MATGDIQNNLRKLKGQLKLIGYPHEPNYERLSQGYADAFLAIYHYLMVDYSASLAQHVADMGLEFYAKTDMRFMQAMYKALREVFSYKPPLTKEQFFSNGFAERKIIMCTEIVTKTKDWHKLNAPHTAGRPNKSTIIRSKIQGPRPGTASARQTVNIVSNVAVLPTVSQHNVALPNYEPNPDCNAIYAERHMSSDEPIFNATSDTYTVKNMYNAASVTDHGNPPGGIVLPGTVDESCVIDRMSSASLESTNKINGVTSNLNVENTDTLCSQQKLTMLHQMIYEMNERIEQLESVSSHNQQFTGRLAALETRLSALEIQPKPDRSNQNITARVLLLENQLAIVESRASTTLSQRQSYSHNNSSFTNDGSIPSEGKENSASFIPTLCRPDT